MIKNLRNPFGFRRFFTLNVFNYQSFSIKSVRLNRANRAGTCAGAAAYALALVDFELSVAHGNSANRTLALTGSAADTGIGNFVCHYKFSFDLRYYLFGELFSNSYYNKKPGKPQYC